MYPRVQHALSFSFIEKEKAVPLEYAVHRLRRSRSQLFFLLKSQAVSILLFTECCLQTVYLTPP